MSIRVYRVSLYIKMYIPWYDVIDIKCKNIREKLTSKGRKEGKKEKMKKKGRERGWEGGREERRERGRDKNRMKVRWKKGSCWREGRSFGYKRSTVRRKISMRYEYVILC